MVISIKRLKLTEDDTFQNQKDATGLYLIQQKGREFKIICKFDKMNSSISIAGKKGTLHINENGIVIRQIVELSGACGLNITEEPVEGLSSAAIRGIMLMENEKNIESIVMETLE